MDVKKRKKRKNAIKHMDAAMICVFFVFLLYAFSLVFPFLFMIVNSFKDAGEFFKGSIWGLPSSLTFDNYSYAFLNLPVQANIFGHNMQFNMLHMFMVSIAITISSMIVNSLAAGASAYVIAKFKFRGKDLIYGLIIVMMTVPIVGNLPAKYRMMSAVGLIDNPVGLLLLYANGAGMPFLILYGFFKNMASGYAEAAYLDGASEVKVFFKIMLPIAMPALTSVSILFAIGVWNDYTTASIFMRKIPTLSVGLNIMLIDLRHRSAYPQSFAAMTIALLPILLVFIGFQKIIMKNTIAGGLKG